jgi:hypothetical protein
MSGEAQAEQVNENVGERPTGWFAFNEKPVMLQLREPYIGCTYAYQATQDESSGGVRAVPVLSGVLHVEPDGCGGVMLVVQMPTGHGSDFAMVALKPADVVYCTHIHQSRIVTQ